MSKLKKQEEIIIELDNYELTEEDKTLFEAPTKREKQLCRWFLTINNPFWTESDVEETQSELEFKDDYYNLDYVKSFNNVDLFEFHYVKTTAIVDEKKIEKVLKEVEDENSGEKKLVEVDVEKIEKVKKSIVVERPYFKSYEHFKSYLENLQVDGLKYSVGQVEKGHEGTTHLQFGVIFDERHAKRFYTMKKYFPTAYLAQARGTNYDIKVYCTKLETRVEEPFEIGTFVEMRRRTDYDEFRTALKSGASDSELFDNFYQIASVKGIDKIREERDIFFNSKYKSSGRNLVTVYIYGPPGVGKTKTVYKHFGFENVFRVSYYGKFQFNGYNGEKTILLDEFAGQMNLSWLNQVLDSYPLRLEVKGGDRIACYENVIICSNIPFSEVYKELITEENQLYQSVYRRINFIYQVDKNGNFIKEKDSIFEEIPENEIELPGITKRVSKSFVYDNYGRKQCVYDFHSKIEKIEFKELYDVDPIFD